MALPPLRPGWTREATRFTEAYRGQWTVEDAVRENVQNALDESDLAGGGDRGYVTITANDAERALRIRDFGRGIDETALDLGEFEKPNNYLLRLRPFDPIAHTPRGQHGEGGKISWLVLLTLGHAIDVRSSKIRLKPFLASLRPGYYSGDNPGNEEPGERRRLVLDYVRERAVREGTTVTITFSDDEAYDRGKAWVENAVLNLPSSPAHKRLIARSPNAEIWEERVNEEGKSRVYSRDIFVRQEDGIFSYNILSAPTGTDRTHFQESNAVDFAITSAWAWIGAEHADSIEKLLRGVAENMYGLEGDSFRREITIPGSLEGWLEFLHDQEWRLAMMGDLMTESLKTGVPPPTREKLLETFGSDEEVREAQREYLTAFRAYAERGSTTVHVNPVWQVRIRTPEKEDEEVIVRGRDRWAPDFLAGDEMLVGEKVVLDDTGDPRVVPVVAPQAWRTAFSRVFDVYKAGRVARAVVVTDRRLFQALEYRDYVPIEMPRGLADFLIACGVSRDIDVVTIHKTEYHNRADLTEEEQNRYEDTISVWGQAARQMPQEYRDVLGGWDFMWTDEYLDDVGRPREGVHGQSDHGRKVISIRRSSLQDYLRAFATVGHEWNHAATELPDGNGDFAIQLEEFWSALLRLVIRGEVDSRYLTPEHLGRLKCLVHADECWARTTSS